MSFVKVKVKMPPANEGDLPIERELNINQDIILYVVKPTFMEPICMTRDTRMAIADVSMLTIPKFEIPEGGEVWIGPSNVIFWHAADVLGRYVIGLPGAVQIIVKSTRSAMEMAFGTPSGDKVGGLVL